MLLIYASVVHLLMLGAATLISAYEPWGATRRGRRDAKQRRVKRSVNGKARIVPGTRASDGADATEAQEGFDRVNKTPHQRTEAREGNPIDEHSSDRFLVSFSSPTRWAPCQRLIRRPPGWPWPYAGRRFSSVSSDSGVDEERKPFVATDEGEQKRQHGEDRNRRPSFANLGCFRGCGPKRFARPEQPQEDTDEKRRPA
jgi:hypothetical protein